MCLKFRFPLLFYIRPCIIRNREAAETKTPTHGSAFVTIVS